MFEDIQICDWIRGDCAGGGDSSGGLGDDVELLDVDQIQWFASEPQVQDRVKYQLDLDDRES